MTALTQNKPRSYSGTPQRGAAPLAASTRVYEGEAIGLKVADGTARSLVAGDVFMGFAAAAVSSIGSAASVSVPLVFAGEVQLEVGGVTAADVASAVFAVDGDSFALSGTSFAGVIVRVPQAGVAVVAFEAARSALTSAQVAGINDDGRIIDASGAVHALSELAPGQVETTATGTAVSGACEYAGFVVRAVSGTVNVTVYDATSATGTPIHTASGVTLTGGNDGSAYYGWAGNKTRINSTGCHVVIAGGGTCTLDVLAG